MSLAAAALTYLFDDNAAQAMPYEYDRANLSVRFISFVVELAKELERMIIDLCNTGGIPN